MQYMYFNYSLNIEIMFHMACTLSCVTTARPALHQLTLPPSTCNQGAWHNRYNLIGFHEDISWSTVKSYIELEQKSQEAHWITWHSATRFPFAMSQTQTVFPRQAKRFPSLENEILFLDQRLVFIVSMIVSNVCKHVPSLIFQVLTWPLVSQLPKVSLNTTSCTFPRCPIRVDNMLEDEDFGAQRRIVLSWLPEARIFLRGSQHKLVTVPVCPANWDDLGNFWTFFFTVHCSIGKPKWNFLLAALTKLLLSNHSAVKTLAWCQNCWTQLLLETSHTSQQ